MVSLKRTKHTAPTWVGQGPVDPADHVLAGTEPGCVLGRAPPGASPEGGFQLTAAERRVVDEAE